jgi:hypothetical protein
MFLGLLLFMAHVAGALYFGIRLTRGDDGEA